MKRILQAALFCAAATVSLAQDFPQGGPASVRYHTYRVTNTEPPYGLAKIKQLIKRLKEDTEGNRQLSDKAFSAMPVAERFTYTMLHGETWSQNCDVVPIMVDEEKKVFAYMAGAFSEAEWSDRQRKFLAANRTKVISLLRSTMQTRRRVGANLKQAIVELKAKELIPDLITAYNRDRKDQDILTCLLLLMKDGKYQPFLVSTSFKKLYGEDAKYMSHLEANSANQKLIKDRAMGYYRSKA